MEHLKNMKTKLVDCIEKQINGNLEYTSTKELGEAVDMVKDLSEAIYYCTITEAMEGKGQQSYGSHYPTTHYYGEPYSKRGPIDDFYYEPHMGGMYPMMYASDGRSGGMGSSGNGGSRYYGDGSRYMSYDSSYSPYPMNEDRSSQSRRRYMDGKRYNDKSMQMQELEKYTQELASDLTDMIKDASPEEKQLLQQKISLLASKIK